MQGQIGHDRLCFCCLHCALACIYFFFSFGASHRVIVGLLGPRGYFWYKHIPFTLASTSVISFFIPSLSLLWQFSSLRSIVLCLDPCDLVYS